MKIKKLFAVLSAAMLGCCALGGTAFAEEAEPVDYSQYQLGDITMDGVVDVDDAQLALQCCADSYAEVTYRSATYEQQLLACAKGFITVGYREYPDTGESENTYHIVEVEDAQSILEYYVDAIAKKTDQTFDEWISADAQSQEVFANEYNRWPHEPSEELVPYIKTVDGEEKILYYYSKSGYAVKVRE